MSEHPKEAVELLAQALAYVPSWDVLHDDRKARWRSKAAKVLDALAPMLRPQWQPIETAKLDVDSSTGCHWFSPCLLGKPATWGWETWVGQLSADEWLGRTGYGSCFGTEVPTHWMPLPPAPGAA